MKMLMLVMVGSILVLCCNDVAQAQDSQGLPYEYTVDEIAENQGVVAYWYAWGYKYAFGELPGTFAKLDSHGLPLRSFNSPHTGAVIDFDDGSLDFDGDMLYSSTGGYPEFLVQTTSGVVTLPGTLVRTDECGETLCCEVLICKEECWKVCDDQDAACKILQWMMWRSFEFHECRYGYRPVDVEAWMASGLAPIDSNWRELAPYMDIEFVYDKCSVKKAYVNCCPPAPQYADCSQHKHGVECGECKPKCGSSNKCKQDNCNTCKPKCGTGNKCKQDNCNTCKPVSKPKCETKCVEAKHENCNECKPKCGSSNKCKQDNCNSCKPKIEKSRCEKPRCEKPRCASQDCNKCHKPRCGGC